MVTHTCHIGRYLGGSFNDDLRLWLKNNQDAMKEKLQVNIHAVQGDPAPWWFGTLANVTTIPALNRELVPNHQGHLVQ